MKRKVRHMHCSSSRPQHGKQGLAKVSSREKNPHESKPKEIVLSKSPPMAHKRARCFW